MTTSGPWRAGFAGGSIVTDNIVKGGVSPDPQTLAFYGGNLIAESVAPCNRLAIIKVPDMMALLREIGIGTISPSDARRQANALLDTLAYDEPQGPAIEPPEAPAGWKLVPVEPTPEMIEAALISWDTAPDIDGSGEAVEMNLTREYRAMLEVAPDYTPPEGS